MATKEKQIEKKDYTVKIEVLVPVTLTMKINAESPQQASEKVSRDMLKFPVLEQTRPAFGRAKKLKIEVFNLGTITKIFSKRF